MSLVRLRKAVVFDRLLARLAVVAPDRWILKGAFALDLRLGERTRTTKDLDLVRRDDEESATADLIACQSVDLEDLFVFAIEKVGRITPDGDGGAVRYSARAELAARPFEHIAIDIGFSGPHAWRPERLRVPDLLSFAGIEPIEVPTLPIEQHIAEKVHGGQQALPDRFPKPPRDWAVVYGKLAREVGIEVDLSAGHREAAAFLDAVLGGLEPGRWDPSTARWI